MILMPKVFHRVWLGDKPMPEKFERWGRSWTDRHPGWAMVTWTAESFGSRFDNLLAQCPNYSQQSDILRYEILLEHGGIYLDTDFECLKNIEPLIDGAKAFAAWQLEDHDADGAIAGGLLGAVPGHPLLIELVNNLPKQDVRQFRSLGPHYLTEHARRHSTDFLVLEQRHFYPYSWNELHRRGEKFTEAYAVHHWAGKWYPDSFIRRVPRQ